MDKSEHRTRWPQGQRVANGGSVGNSLDLGPTAPTPNRTQVHSCFNWLDLRWQRRVHVRQCYPPRELANGEFKTRFCNVCPIWRWPDIGGNALSRGPLEGVTNPRKVLGLRLWLVSHELITSGSPTEQFEICDSGAYCRGIWLPECGGPCDGPSQAFRFAGSHRSAYRAENCPKDGVRSSC